MPVAGSSPLRVAAAARELAGVAGAVEGEGDAHMVLQAAELHRVQRDAQAGRAGADGGDDGGGVVRDGAGCGRQAGGGQGGQRAIGRAGGGQQRGQAIGGRAGLAARAVTAAASLRSSARASLRRRSPCDAGGVQQGMRHGRQGDVQAGGGDADGGQRLDADEGDLGIRLGAIGADQLDAGLGDLALGGQLEPRTRSTWPE
jgi:hypothetical protein